MPKTWPNSDSEFTLTEQQIADCAYHINVECEHPDNCGYATALFMHHCAQAALLTLDLLVRKDPL